MSKFRYRLGGILLLLALIVGLTSVTVAQDDVIKVGILHSLSGTMSISEVTVKDSTLMAIRSRRG